MIQVTIDGKRVYPDTSQSIKITYENPYVNDSGEYTYDISFPMQVLENKEMFRNVDRFDVSKRLATYEECRIFADNHLVVSGKGVVTQITDKLVKLQITGGSSRIKYNAKWEKHFIDRIDYGEAVIRQGIDQSRHDKSSYPIADLPSSISWGPYISVDLSASNIIGDEGVFVLAPIFDESTGYLINNLFKNKNTANNNTPTILYSIAPQPYLMYILKKVLEYEGFTVVRNDFDADPWNRLVIANARRVTKLSQCLPHWSVYFFIDEVRKLFNASFRFDDEKKTVSIEAVNELVTNPTVTYEVEDEFTAEYDEDGLTNLITSNVEYGFSTSANRQWWEVVSLDIRDRFASAEYTTEYEMANAAHAMSKKQRQTTIFHTTSDNRYWVWYDAVDEDGQTNEYRRVVGQFSPIVRNKDSDDNVTLKISPVAFFKRNKVEETDTTPPLFFTYDQFKDATIYVPSTESGGGAANDALTSDDDGGAFISIKDALEGAEFEADETDGSEVLQVMFVGKNVRYMKTGFTYPVGTDIQGDEGEGNWWWPITFTDANMPATWTMGVHGEDETASLSLYSIQHVSGTLAQVIDKNNQLTVKFITDDIPSPSDIYVFHNKKYVCSKIEMNIIDNRIDREKTGYFYEIL